MKVKDLQIVLDSVNDEGDVCVSYFSFSAGEMIITKGVSIAATEAEIVIIGDPV